MQSYNPAIAKYVNEKNAGKPHVLVINTLLHSLAALAANLNAEFDVSGIRPRLGGLPYPETFTWQNLTPAQRVTRSGRPGYPPWRVTPPIM